MAACGSDEEPQGEGESRFEESVALVEVPLPLRNPTWSPTQQALIALGEDGCQLAKVAM